MILVCSLCHKATTLLLSFHSSPKPFPLKPLYLNFSILLASPGNFTFLAWERPLLFCFYFGFILESLILQSCLFKFFNSVIIFYTTVTCSMILVLLSSPLRPFFDICPFGPLLKAFLLSVSDLRYFKLDLPFSHLFCLFQYLFNVIFFFNSNILFF